MTLLKADYELRNVINWMNENREVNYNMERNVGVDYLLTYEDGKWCLYDVMKQNCIAN